MNTKRIHIVIPGSLLDQIDIILGKQSRSRFLALAAEKELMRVRQIKALEAAVGSWKDEDHFELKNGAAEWVVKMRQQDEKRFQKVAVR